MSTGPITPEDVYDAFACRVWIHGRGGAAGYKAKDSFKNWIKRLGERCAERLNGYRKTQLDQKSGLHHLWRGARKEIQRQLQSMLSSRGDVLCGDERLFYYWKGGTVRKLPKACSYGNMASPSGCSVILLPTGDPYLAYTMVHNTSDITKRLFCYQLVILILLTLWYTNTSENVGESTQPRTL